MLAPRYHRCKAVAQLCMWLTVYMVWTAALSQAVDFSEAGMLHSMIYI